MNTAVLVLLTAVLGYACFEHAGVVPQQWNPIAIAIGIAGAIYFLVPRRKAIPPFNRSLGTSIAVVLGVAVFQLVPLPVSLVRLFSPARAGLAQAAAPFTGGMPGLIALSVGPYATAQAMVSLAVYAVVFLLVRDLSLRTARRPWAAAAPLIAVVGLEALLGFLQALGTGGDASGTYNSRDHYAGLLEMALPFALMYAVAILQRSRRPGGASATAALAACAMMSVAALIVIGSVLSLSRMGFLCALVSMPIAGILAFRPHGAPAEGKRRSPWRKALPAAAALTVVLAGMIFLPTDVLIKRFAALAPGDDIAPDIRAELWRETAPLIRDYPLFGCGLGTYESAFLRYKLVAPMNTADFAHNDYLQVLAELGIFGFAAGLFFVMRIFLGAGREALRSESIDERCLAAACVAAMSAMLLHSFVDFNMYVPANAMVFAWIAGIASRALASPRASAALEPQDMDARLA